MPQDMNSVNIIGRLTRDAEERVAGETKILGLRLAVNDRRKVQGEWQDVGMFFDVTYFPRVDWMAERMVKGARVAIAGKLQWREWTSNDGSKRQSVEILANEIWPLDARAEGGPRSGGVLPDDEIPF